MKTNRTRIPFAVFGFIALAFDAQAAAEIDASVVQLRKSCTENGVLLNNCFTTLSEMNDWVFNQRNPPPSAASPVLVEIGPGVFEGSFLCQDSGHVTLRGAGMSNTIIDAGGAYPVSTNACENMTFMDMTLKSQILGIRGDGGITFWKNIEVQTSGLYSWFEATGRTCTYTVPGKHYWFNSRIINRSAQSNSVTYGAQCDESWFFGSEIVMEASGSTGEFYAIKTAVPALASSEAGRGVVHVYGGVVRTISSNISSSATVGAIKSTASGAVHVHGAGIDVLASGANPIVVLSSITNGAIHANETAYNLDTGVGGTIKRVSKDETGHIHAPYLWEVHSDVPYAGSGKTFESITGFDSAIVTTNSSGAPDHPHLVIYDSTCTGSKWFDITTNQCR